ncbi:MAG: sodium:proton antiporter [Saprospiraceae bacterium]|nr:sodium:proton antiporter [Saprospiraceae bacterium]
MFQSVGILVALAAVFSLLNYRYMKWPSTIGLMFMALVSSILIFVSKEFVPAVYIFFGQLITNLDFENLLLNVLLSFLLFAGAMQVNLHELARERWSVLALATLGTTASTFFIGGSIFGIGILLGLDFPFLHALLFGALISPTDPIAVLAILDKVGISKSLRLRIEGESLFNDGIGVVLFLTILSLIQIGGSLKVSEIGLDLLLEIGGGIGYGLLLAWIGDSIIRKNLDDPKVCLLSTLAIATGGYSLAGVWHISGPLAMVVAGLGVGWQLAHVPKSSETFRTLKLFWGSLDNILNAMLFVLIGLLAHTLEFNRSNILLGLLAIPVVLVGRLFAVLLGYSLTSLQENHPAQNIAILVWGGLRGGLAVALALSINTLETSGIIIFTTYLVAVFSILVQGLTLRPLANLFKKQ